MSSVALQAGILGAPLSPTLGLAGDHRTGHGFSLAIGLTWVVLPATEHLAAGGEAESRSAFVRVAPALDLGFGSFEVELGPALAMGGERGTTAGLAESDVKVRAVAAAGAQASLRYDIAETLTLSLIGGAEAPFRPFGGAFVVDGSEVLEPPLIRAFVAIGVGPTW